MIARILLDVRSGRLTDERAKLLARSMREQMARFGNEYSRRMLVHIRLAANEGAFGHLNGIKAVSSNTGIALSAAMNPDFVRVPIEALNALMRRRGIAMERGLLGYSAQFRTLVERNLKLAAAQIDDLLMEAVGRGFSWTQTTQELGVQLAQNSPEVQDMMRRIGPRGGFKRSTFKAIREGAKLDATTLSQARKLMKRAQLIAIHETNSAYDEANKFGAVKSPMVEALQWELSGAHPAAHSTPDECDVISYSDLYGLGAGVYPPETVPALPHARCKCWTSSILRPPSQWGEKREDPGEPKAMTKRDARVVLEARKTSTGRAVTDSVVRRATISTNRVVRAAKANPIPAPDFLETVDATP